MFSFFKKQTDTQSICCPHCLEEQAVSPNAISAYCKNCRKRIDVGSIIKPPPKETNKWKPKTKNVSCPYCHSLQEVLSSALSAYCKNCQKRMPVGENISDENAQQPSFKTTNGERNPASPSTSPLGHRDIKCPHCGMPQKVPTTALSSFCSDCGNRVNLQNYDIQGRFQGDLETKGTIYIASDGNVSGNINTGSLIVAGKYEGEIVAEDKVELLSTAKVVGKIIAPVMIVHPGAILLGHTHIGKTTCKLTKNNTPLLEQETLF